MTDSSYIVSKTKNGLDVYFDPGQSHAATHVKQNPKLIDFAMEVIPTLVAEDDTVFVDRDLAKMIGLTDLVQTGDGDEIIFAKRPLRDGYSRFVKNKKSIPTSSLALILRRDPKNNYLIHTIFFGKISPVFPDDELAQEESKKFWSDHALVWGSQEIVPGTETAVCPW